MTEIIREIEGVEYFVRDDGKLFSTKNIGRGKYHKEISQRLRYDGYPIVTVGKTGHRRQKTVHRIIAETFIPNPNNLPEVDHIDGIRTNNNANNLQWITGFENKSKIPFKNRSECRIGSKNGNAKLSEQDVLSIRESYSNNASISEIAKKYKCGWTTISHIVKRETWKTI